MNPNKLYLFAQYFRRISGVINYFRKISRGTENCDWLLTWYPQLHKRCTCFFM